MFAKEIRSKLVHPYDFGHCYSHFGRQCEPDKRWNAPGMQFVMHLLAKSKTQAKNGCVIM